VPTFFLRLEDRFPCISQRDSSGSLRQVDSDVDSLAADSKNIDAVKFSLEDFFCAEFFVETKRSSRPDPRRVPKIFEISHRNPPPLHC
jgi:hypothetical protein